ncbi:hypothetical protein ABK040_004699 [Willaertia magna]
MNKTRNILVYGGFGNLGKNLITTLKNKPTSSYQIISIDFQKNKDANHSIVLDLNKIKSNWIEQALSIEKELSYLLQNNKLEAIYNVAGGFTMGNLKDDNLFEQVQSMFQMSVQTSIQSCKLGNKFLNENGLLVLPGASSASNPTPFALAYGLAKSSVHQLVRSCSNNKVVGLPEGTCTVGIMPVILDTLQNREAMPNEDFTNWTPLQHVSDKLMLWLEENQERPKTGSLIRIVTKKGDTIFIEE